jgi:hypothetical protein
MQSCFEDSGVHLGLQLLTWEFTWEWEGSFPHILCTLGNMWCDSQVSLLARNLTTFYLGRKPKARVETPKVVRIPIVGIPRFPLGNPKTKCHLDASLVEKHKVYYKGEGDGFPQVRAVVSLMNLRLFVVRHNTKNV